MSSVMQWIERATQLLQSRAPFQSSYWALAYSFDNPTPNLTNRELGRVLDAAKAFPYPPPYIKFASRFRDLDGVLQLPNDWWDQRVWWCASRDAEGFFADLFGIGSINDKLLFREPISARINEQLDLVRHIGANVAPSTTSLELHMVAVGLDGYRLAGNSVRFLDHSARGNHHHASVTIRLDAQNDTISRSLLDVFCNEAFGGSESEA